MLIGSSSASIILSLPNLNITALSAMAAAVTNSANDARLLRDRFFALIGNPVLFFLI